MEKISFKDIYVENVLNKIKRYVAKQIVLDKNTFENRCKNTVESRMEKADRVMREVLSDLLLENTNSKGEASYKYNFLVFTEGREELARQEIMCSLVMYYTALYFDNVPLLQKLLREGIYLESNPNDLRLCFLDKEISNAFDSETYSDILKEKGEYFKPCYDSIKKESFIARKKYIKKFANILQNREIPSDYSLAFCFEFSMFTKSRLDLYEEETYMKATNDQLRYIIADDVEDSLDEDFYKKLNEVIKTTDFYIERRSNDYLKTVVDLFTTEELAVLKIDYTTALWFNDSYNRGADMERVKRIYLAKPEISQFSGFLYPNILDLYDDEAICSFSSETINNLKYDDDRRLLTGDLTVEREAKIRKIVEGRNKSNGLLVKIFKK